MTQSTTHSLYDSKSIKRNASSSTFEYNLSRQVTNNNKNRSKSVMSTTNKPKLNSSSINFKYGISFK
jgi:hypothetical protein